MHPKQHLLLRLRLSPLPIKPPFFLCPAILNADCCCGPEDNIFYFSESGCQNSINFNADFLL